MRFSISADIINTLTGTFAVAPTLLDAGTNPIEGAGHDILTAAVGIVIMLMTKAAGKLIDKWFDKKETIPATGNIPVPTTNLPDSITLNKPTENDKENSK